MRNIEQTGYDGFWSLELFNADLWAADPFEAAARCHQACEAFAAGMTSSA